MNYEENTRDWNVGDLVLHDADEKSERMLMWVVEAKRTDGLIKTAYLNMTGSVPYYLNRKEVLHDPAIFSDGMIPILDQHGVPKSLKEDMETLLSMAIEVKKDNTDEFMIYFKGRVNGLVSKYVGGDWR